MSVISEKMSSLAHKFEKKHFEETQNSFMERVIVTLVREKFLSIVDGAEVLKISIENFVKMLQEKNVPIEEDVLLFLEEQKDREGFEFFKGY